LALSGGVVVIAGHGAAAVTELAPVLQMQPAPLPAGIALDSRVARLGVVRVHHANNVERIEPLVNRESLP
jgi:hypothetical protein